MATMKGKSVSFNIDDPIEKDLYAWCLTIKNFSGYVKTLILEDKPKSKAHLPSKSFVIGNGGKISGSDDK